MLTGFFLDLNYYWFANKFKPFAVAHAPAVSVAPVAVLLKV
jgi:hypothetical protein